MKTRIEKLDERIADARKQLHKACDKRDAAIKMLGKAAANIVDAQRKLARTEKLRVIARTEARKAKKDKTPILAV